MTPWVTPVTESGKDGPGGAWQGLAEQAEASLASNFPHFDTDVASVTTWVTAVTESGKDAQIVGSRSLPAKDRGRLRLFLQR